jgi:hypothetical protein
MLKVELLLWDILLVRASARYLCLWDVLIRRLFATRLPHLRRTKQKKLVTSMCIGMYISLNLADALGTDMSAAALFIHEAMLIIGHLVRI